MKTLVMIRHGRKDGELLAKEQIAEIHKNGVPGLNELVFNHSGLIVLHLGTGFERTEQTIKSFERYLDTSNKTYGFNGYLMAENRLGNKKMFERFKESKYIIAEAEKTNWFKAFQTYDPYFIKKVQAGMIKTIASMLFPVNDGDMVISVGHTPLIEWLAFGLDPEKKIPRDIKLKELTGFIFTEDQGHIRVTGTIGF